MKLVLRRNSSQSREQSSHNSIAIMLFGCQAEDDEECGAYCFQRLHCFRAHEIVFQTEPLYVLSYSTDDGPRQSCYGCSIDCSSSGDLRDANSIFLYSSPLLVPRTPILLIVPHPLVMLVVPRVFDTCI
ncbi:hypothetical protein M9H77_12130 [Catharanthus roseus]|uniref:Uncharacterized protein n=1 Tax=Catharanthus roseus TaxID=4058 RepID=A0ACC0BGJ5_CATRO|nr:hypothetical protein M9H77_12130 [Catharanthus roseus]